ncbi:AAA family ATPase [Candidatus Magnetominusculus xianensis]|uniref:Histidine kinase n=1 Tax=Candidatus Magnetominusculus xianensis TaxID=1748249 RepID=A0ABR5SCG8_9BACT|nr:cytidylate kinase-like family protein [Candidatus Magnetominusculus xianensis]KWT75001.1 histidine kinase [Candidatus Magnetominusculus xianensis]MBF0404932.1 cytidylate kinase-like family protein [Nitrospirota bacterium]
MSVITINNQPYSRGREIAEAVAAKTGSELLTVEQITTHATEEYQVSPEQIRHACENPQAVPIVYGMSLEERYRYLAYYEAALMRFLLRDNIVFCGFAGRVLLEGISHIFKTYISSSLADRTSVRAARENISQKTAEEQIIKEYNAHKKLIKALYKFEVDNPKLYDMALNIGQITVEDAIEIITTTSQSRRFQPMTYSTATAKNTALMYRVRASLIHIDPNVSVCYECSSLIIHSRAIKGEKQKRTAAIKSQLKSIPEAAVAEIIITEDFTK